MENSEYNEEIALTNYVWDNCRNLMTEFELAVERAVFFREKASRAAGAVKAKLLEELQKASTHEVKNALSKGWEKFRREAGVRIIREHREWIILSGSMTTSTRCLQRQRIIHGTKRHLLQTRHILLSSIRL